MKRINFYHSLLLMMTLLAAKGFSQLSVETSLSTMLDDNVNNNYEQLGSAVTTVGVTGGYAHINESSEYAIQYNGDFNYFQSILQRSHQSHTGTLSYIRYSGDDAENVFRIIGSYGIQRFRDDYVLFNHDDFAASFDYKYFISDWWIHKMGYTFRAVDFVTLADFSFSEHAAFLNGAFAMTPSTTVILQSDIGTKFYSSSVNGSSMRKGVMSSLLPSVTQVAGLVRIGQRITDQLGLSGTASMQWNLQKQTRYMTTDYGYLSDDEIFDDHYGYEGMHGAVAMTYLLSESMRWKLTMGMQEKLYSSLAAFDLNGTMTGTQRIDLRSYMNVLITKEFENLGFIIKTAFDLIDNSSNDQYYNYGNSAFTVEIDVPL